MQHWSPETRTNQSRSEWHRRALQRNVWQLTKVLPHKNLELGKKYGAPNIKTWSRSKYGCISQNGSKVLLNWLYYTKLNTSTLWLCTMAFILCFPYQRQYSGPKNRPLWNSNPHPLWLNRGMVIHNFHAVVPPKLNVNFPVFLLQSRKCISECTGMEALPCPVAIT